MRTEARKMAFLCADGTDAHFMDTESASKWRCPRPASPRRCLE